jgi:hydrogenase expression/formation protein HypC
LAFVLKYINNTIIVTNMCIAIPAKVVDVKGDIGKVDFGGGLEKDVNLMLVDVKPGDYVIVHAGCAIEVLEEEDALRTIAMFQEILEQDQ